MQLSMETTIFMQKAIYYISRLIAARGVIELTDCNLNFQVSPFDASFGIKDVSIELISIEDVRIEGGDLHPRVVVFAIGKKYEFVLSKGQELYDRLKKYTLDPLSPSGDQTSTDSTIICRCGKQIKRCFIYCPWCGAEVPAANIP